MENKVSSEDLYRKYVDHALTTILPYKSSETGLLHLHSEIYEGLPVQAAPTYENFLFVLLLLRKKTHEHVAEAKTLLRRLLSFQNFQSDVQYGNFPTELTEYPVCREWLLSVRLGLALAVIRADFSTVLGDELLSSLVHAQKALLLAATATKEQRSFSISNQMLLDIERALLDPTALFELQEERFIHSLEWMSPHSFGKVLAAASYLPQSTLLPSFAEQLWHKKATTYQGPACGVYQFGKDPEVTLFDFFCSLLTDTALVERSWSYLDALEVSLLNPKNILLGKSLPFPKEEEWSLHTHGEVSIASCFFVPKAPEGFYPIRIVTPDCTFALHFPHGSLLSLEPQGDRFVGTVHRNKEPEEDDPCLIRCFVERKKQVLLLPEERATTFDPFEGVAIDVAKWRMSLVLGKQEASCFGHIGLHNRPGQILARKKLDSFGYDWLISIDYLRGRFQNPFTFFVSFSL